MRDQQKLQQNLVSLYFVNYKGHWVVIRMPRGIVVSKIPRSIVAHDFCGIEVYIVSFRNRIKLQ